jgi:hypothetical protein
VASAIHNPSGWQLAPEDEAELQTLIDAANAELEELHGQMSETARAWARLRIANGYFEEVRPGEDRRHQGSLLLRVTDRYGIRRDVVIWPGECAELDVLTADIDAHIENAHRQVADFVESRGLSGDDSSGSREFIVRLTAPNALRADRYQLLHGGLRLSP